MSLTIKWETLSKVLHPEVYLYVAIKNSCLNQFANVTSQIDLGLQRNFMGSKAALRLIFSDIYKGTKASSVQQVQGFYIRNYSYFEARQVKT